MTFVNMGPGGTVQVHGSSRSEATKQRLRPGTTRRVLSYVRPQRWTLAFLLFLMAVNSVIIVAVPLLLRELVDNGVLAGDHGMVMTIALAVAALAFVDAALQLAQSYYSGKIGQGVTYGLRVQVFSHVRRQPIAFFTRVQSGSLLSRLNADIMAAQQALATLVVSASSVFVVLLVVAEMFYLSWEISLLAIALLAVSLVPVWLIGRLLQRYSREQMQVNADMSATVNERFNVAGAMLTKLFGRPHEEDAVFAGKAARVRDIGVRWAVYSRMSFVVMAMVATFITALVYGLGGILAIDGAFQIGTLVALAALLGRVFGPIQQLTSMQSNVLTTLVSFDRIFEVLDLRPMVEERPEAVPLRAPGDGPAPEVEFDRVSFHYPRASEVSLPTLEVVQPAPDDSEPVVTRVLHELSFRLPAGKLTALVGPSGGGKTTITHLVSRLYDPTAGSVLVDGHDLRDVTLASLRDVVGVVTQDAHLFHDTIRNNLAYAHPTATEQELVEACRSAQIWDLVSSLPNGLDTMAGDRGYRLSGGEKQRFALARLLLKAPSIVVLDEATAHLDSESELAVQRALRTALAGRTSLVIAHRLSTIREADQILVIDEGRVRERGTHEELHAAGGLYAELYDTQFARQATADGKGRTRPEPGEPASRPVTERETATLDGHAGDG